MGPQDDHPNQDDLQDFFAVRWISIDFDWILGGVLGGVWVAFGILCPLPSMPMVVINTPRGTPGDPKYSFFVNNRPNPILPSNSMQKTV